MKSWKAFWWKLRQPKPLVVRFIGGAQLLGPFTLAVGDNLIINDSYTRDGQPSLLIVGRVGANEITMTCRSLNDTGIIVAQPALRKVHEHE